MDDEYENRKQQHQSDDKHAEFGALESAESHLARSPSSSDQSNASGQEFSASFGALLEWGEKARLICLESEFPFIQRSPDGYGDEHEAWFDEETNRWFNATIDLNIVQPSGDLLAWVTKFVC